MSKVIPGVDLTACQPWDAPSMRLDRGDTDAVQDPQLPTDEELKALRERARKEGFALGHELGVKRGLAAGQQQIEIQCQRLGEVLDALARPFENLDRQVEQELAALAIAMVRQLTRREIKTDPGVVIAAVRESLDVLPVASREVTLHLHPDDAALVREVHAGSDQETAWTIAENPGLTAGGCRVTTDTSQVDNTVEHRLAAAITRVFGSERLGDSAAPPPPTDADSTSEEAASGRTAPDVVP